MFASGVYEYSKRHERFKTEEEYNRFKENKKGTILNINLLPYLLKKNPERCLFATTIKIVKINLLYYCSIPLILFFNRFFFLNLPPALVNRNAMKMMIG